MEDKTREKVLKVVLIVVGIGFLSLYPLGLVWPSGWLWGMEMGMAHSHYIYMIYGVYATLAVFLFLAARDPSQHKSLIWFTAWSNLAHAVVMGVQAIGDPAEGAHLFADVPALVIMAAALAVFAPRDAAQRR